MPEPLSSLLLPQAANNRHGLVFKPQTAYLSKSDVPDVFHVGVPFAANNPWKSASGGVGIVKQDATLAAIGEGVERYCAGINQVPLKVKTALPKHKLIDAEQWTLFSQTQRDKNNFPYANLYSNKCAYTNVFELGSNNEYWVPHPLVVLRDDYETGIPTSSGLAAGATATQATLRAVQELIERDALMATWLHSIAGHVISIPDKYNRAVNKIHGEVHVFDITPAYSPFPVIAIAGGIPKRGKWRYSLGVACRETLAQATEKAYLEWCQGVFFAGVYPKYVDTKNMTEASDVKSFDDHAIYYTQNPDKWSGIPLMKNQDQINRPVRYGKKLEPRLALSLVTTKLNENGIRLYYRDLTTIDALQSGIRVVRVLSPDLIPINSHHEWPFVGGNADNVTLRYPWAITPTIFPNPYPHPLG
jgi:ribosomal protein S12 methylthiotransferase accessory factor